MYSKYHPDSNLQQKFSVSFQKFRFKSGVDDWLQAGDPKHSNEIDVLTGSVLDEVERAVSVLEMFGQ
jgi:hypothetical protein